MFHPISEHCLQLIRQGQRYDPVYGRGLANHLPMALAALAFQGASENQLDAFYHHYTGQLVPMRPACTDAQTPTLGNRADFGRFLSRYRRQIHQQGIEQTVRHALPELLPGLISAAFHGVIRLSYGVTLQDPDEVAIALAYWASEYQTLGALHQSETIQAEQQLRLVQHHFAAHSYQPGLIVDRIAELSSLPEFASLAVTPADLNEPLVARLTIRHYLATNNFTLLHGVTGFQALHQLQPYLAEPALALRYYWQAFVAALGVAGTAAPPVSIRDCPPLQWAHWQAQTCTSDDDHTIKLIYSCQYLYHHFSLPEYPAAIMRRLAKENP
ncbi:DUF4243 domain-containing protein [Photobacterium ganghwense]|uniref:Questin oxidase family protein n=2 Tax=Photobacterium ganghwense TaxID=320778 RepID=A0A0J1JZA5_9GAMM|nr:questin oxidase family protein [Photobacterium ganghwense]KLV07562.1 hypothetical protein ABT57_16830 [Photobacterium ganghwense]PSU11588.1 DUF4243 domain-containing protein [Photobacterium ganghwense]QSV13703.1 questin oxidase family protein [Photobacterium ganghwense]